MSSPFIFVSFFYWYTSAGGQDQGQDHEDKESYEDHESDEGHERT
jgi:hypothetical protein